MKIERDKNTTFYTQKEVITDVASGEILSFVEKTIAKTSAEPDFIKVYYETMLAFNQIHDIPLAFVLSISKFISWSNEGEPMLVSLNKLQKETIGKDCGVSLPQVDRYIKTSVKNGLLFRTNYRAVYEVNPFMIARGRWESIRKLRTNFDFVEGKWERVIEEHDSE